MKKLFTFLMFVVSISMVTAQTTYYSEDFNAGLPDGWTTDEVGWMVGTPDALSSAYFAVPASADGNVACFNDDGLGNGAVGGGSMTSAAIDLTEVEAPLWLEFKSYWPNLDYQGDDETAIVSISTDMGMTWTELKNLVGGNTADFDPEFMDISDYAGQTIWLQFTYDDGQQWNYGWAIDDISISDAITSVPPRSYFVHAGGATMMDMAQEGVEYKVSGFMGNRGLETITSYDLVLTDGTETVMESFTDMDIPFNTTVRFDMSQGIMVEGNKAWTLSIENINGNMEEDEVTDDNRSSFNLNAVSDMHPDKGVVIEEATGTWCTWCPRGTVFIEEMSKRFKDNFVGIAVHNADPMVLGEYDSSITSFPDFPGFPSVIFEREEILDPGDIVAPSRTEMTIAPPAGITVGATFDEATRSFVGSVEVNFLQDVSADHTVLIVLTEDGVTGAGNDWAQINAYSGGGQGPMGGYELLPGAVPAELMVYNHVARALIGGFDGVADVVTGDFLAGDTKGYIFDSFTIPSNQVETNMHVIGLLVGPDGSITNAKSVSMADALANGLTSTKAVFRNDLANVFPNPASHNATIELNLETSSTVFVEVFNATGQRVVAQNHGTLSGNNMLSLSTTDFANGIYTVHIKLDENTSIVKKLSVQK